jgi:hypothetical protein
VEALPLVRPAVSASPVALVPAELLELESASPAALEPAELLELELESASPAALEPAELLELELELELELASLAALEPVELLELELASVSLPVPVVLVSPAVCVREPALASLALAVQKVPLAL